MSKEAIRVMVRFRPINAREMSEQNQFQPVIKFIDKCTVEVAPTEGASTPSTFSFDQIFDMSTTQEYFYSCAGQRVVEFVSVFLKLRNLIIPLFSSDVLSGYNGTIFAYGQTGAGKSWSMMGNISNPELHGIMPRASRAIFEAIEKADDKVEFKIACNYIEIYNESIQDLFDTSKKNLNIRESPGMGIYVESLTTEYVSSEDEIYELLEMGTNNRVVSFTNMNANSSRSHSVFVITVSQTFTETGTTKTGKLNLVDLAGSEKVGKTGATGQTLEEAKKINQSLTSLGMCINALVEGKPHVPFRDSKLTRMLQESLGGNSKTTMICACSPHPFNLEETAGTLKFGQRAKTIKLAVKVNSVKSAKELQIIVDKLTGQLKSLQEKNVFLTEQLTRLKNGEKFEIILDADSSQQTPPKQGPAASDERKEINNPALLQSQTETNSKGGADPLAFAELQVELELWKSRFNSEVSKLKEELEDERLLSKEAMNKMDELQKALEKSDEDLEILMDEQEKSEQQLKDFTNRFEFEKKEIQMELVETKKQVEELEKQREDMKKELAASKSGRSYEYKLQPESSAVESSTKTSSSDSGASNFATSILKERLIELEEALEKEKATNIKLTAENNKLKNKRAEKVAALDGDRLNGLLDTVTKERNELRSSLIDLETEMSRLLSDLEGAEKMEEEAKARMEEALRLVDSKNAEVLSLKLKLQSVALAHSPNKEDELESFFMSEYNNDIKQLRESHLAIERKKDLEIKKLRDEVETERANVDVLMKEYEATTKDQKTTINSLQESLNKQKVLFAEFEEDNTLLDQENVKLQSDIAILNEKLKNQTWNESSTSAQIEQLQKEVETLKKKVEEGGKSVAAAAPVKFEGNTATAIHELMQLRETYKKVAEDRAKLEEECNNSRRLISLDRGKLRAAEGKLELQKTRIEELENQLTQMRNSQNARREEREIFKNQRQELLDKIADLNKIIEALQKNNSIRQKRVEKSSKVHHLPRPSPAVDQDTNQDKRFGKQSDQAKPEQTKPQTGATVDSTKQTPLTPVNNSQQSSWNSQLKKVSHNLW